MKHRMVVVLGWLLMAVPAQASQLNLDPYFAVGFSSMSVDMGGSNAQTPSGYVAAGSALNWLSPDLRAEFRFGLGGQMTAFSGDISMYASYLLKPAIEVTRSLDIYALLGLTTMNVSVAGQDSSDSNLSYGLGFSYHIPNESISLNGEWMQYHTASNNSTTSISGMDISGVSLSLQFEYY